MRIVVSLPMTDAQKRRLMEASPGSEFIFHDDFNVTDGELKDAQIILGNLKKASMLKNCQELRWVHLSNAGVDDYCKPGVLPEGVLLANGTGAYGPAISEYMLGAVFALRKKFHVYGRNQSEHLWKQIGHVPLVQNSTVLVLGLGDIGTHFAKKMKALGCYVIGIKRRVGEKPEWLDELHSIDQLETLIQRADILAMSLPGTPETYHILDEKMISLMKSDAIVINVGRGVSVDTDALTKALYEEKIGGAVLDVIENEPLTSEHPIWDAPNTIITPHISGRTMQPDTLDLLVDMFAKNLEHDMKGEKLEYLVDMNTGYRK